MKQIVALAVAALFTVSPRAYRILNGPLAPADADYGKRLILVEYDK